MAGPGAGPDWVPLDVRRWLLGTQFLHPIAEYIYWRLCVTGYERGQSVLPADMGFLMTVCKNVCDHDDMLEHLEALRGEGKVKLGDTEITIPSVEKRLRSVREKRRQNTERTKAATRARTKNLKNGPADLFDNADETIVDETVTSGIREEKSREDYNKTNSRGVVDHDAVRSHWNRMAEQHSLPNCSSITPKRRAQINARAKEHGIDKVHEAIDMIPKSEHCLGKNDRGWVANFDFMLQPSSFVKVIEGVYIRSSAAKTTAFDRATNRFTDDWEFD